MRGWNRLLKNSSKQTLLLIIWWDVILIRNLYNLILRQLAGLK